MVGVPLHPAAHAREPRHPVVPDDVIASTGRRYSLQRESISLAEERYIAFVNQAVRSRNRRAPRRCLSCWWPTIGGSSARVPRASDVLPRRLADRTALVDGIAGRGPYVVRVVPEPAQLVPEPAQHARVKTLGDVNDDHFYLGGPILAFVQLRTLLPCQVAPG